MSTRVCPLSPILGSARQVVEFFGGVIERSVHRVPRYEAQVSSRQHLASLVDLLFHRAGEDDQYLFLFGVEVETVNDPARRETSSTTICDAPVRSGLERVRRSSQASCSAASLSARMNKLLMLGSNRVNCILYGGDGVPPRCRIGQTVEHGNGELNLAHTVSAPNAALDEGVVLFLS